MTELTPLAWALHEQIWPLLSANDRAAPDGNATMNMHVEMLAAAATETPVAILANIWGLHPDEARDWRAGIQAAFMMAGKTGDREKIRAAFQRGVRIIGSPEEELLAWLEAAQDTLAAMDADLAAMERSLLQAELHQLNLLRQAVRTHLTVLREEIAFQIAGLEAELEPGDRPASEVLEGPR